LPAHLRLPAAQDGLGLDTSRIAPFESLYLASLIIGRCAGAAGAFVAPPYARQPMPLLLPYRASGGFLAVNTIAGYAVADFLLYAAVIVVMVAATFASRGNPARMLLIFSLCGIAALLVGMLTTGMASVIAFISVGLFCSTMWPCI